MSKAIKWGGMMDPAQRVVHWGTSKAPKGTGLYIVGKALRELGRTPVASIGGSTVRPYAAEYTRWLGGAEDGNSGRLRRKRTGA